MTAPDRDSREWLRGLGKFVLFILTVFGTLAVLLIVFVSHTRSAMAARFEIENWSGEDIWVTPIGMEAKVSGRYGPLPRIHPGWLAYSIRDHDLFVAPGESLTVKYIWHEVSFRHLLVRTSDDKTYLLDTDGRGNLGLAFPPQHAVYVVGPRKALQEAPEELLPCAQGRAVRYSGALNYIEQDDGTFVSRPVVYEDN